MSQAHGERKRGLANPFPLEEGVCYLVRGKSVDSSYRLAAYRAEEGVPVLCVSRIHPDRLRSKYGLASATVWWISESPGEGHFDPTAVGSLSNAIQEFIERSPEGCFVLLDGVEFITINIGFMKTLLFIEHLNELVMPRRATLLVPADPDCFDPKEFARLDRFTGGIVEEDLRDALDTFEASRDLTGE
jgi:uncharacterized protein DUF835